MGLKMRPPPRGAIEGNEVSEMLRVALSALVSGASSMTEAQRKLLEETLTRWVPPASRGASGTGAMDLSHRYFIYLLGDPARSEDILRAPHGTLVGFLKRSFRRWQHKHGPTRLTSQFYEAVRKVVATDPRFVQRPRGLIDLRDEQVLGHWPRTLWRGETDRIDHAALARAVEAILSREKRGMKRMEIARAITTELQHRISRDPYYPHEVPSDWTDQLRREIDAKRLVEVVIRGLSDRERDLLKAYVLEEDIPAVGAQYGLKRRSAFEAAERVRTRVQTHQANERTTRLTRRFADRLLRAYFLAHGTA